MKKIRLLTVINNLRFGGAEVMTGQILDRLNPKLFSNIVCCLGGPDDLRPTFERHGHRVIYLNTRKSGIVINVLKLIQVIKKEDIDIVSCHLSPSIIYGPLAARLTGRPVVSTVHNVLRFRSRRFIAVEAFSLRFCDRVIAVSQCVKMDMNRYYRLPQGKTILVRNGSDPDKFRSRADAIGKRTNEELSTRPGKRSFVVGTVASLTAQKNVCCLIDSFPKIKRSIERAKLLLVGDGPLRNELEKKVRELHIENDVIFAGNQNDVPKFLKAMDMFVLPSLWEGFGISLVEAMLMEKPVVATNVDGIREVVEDEKTGILIKPDDPSGIANAVIALYHDKEQMKKMAFNGRKRALNLFNIDRTALQFQGVLLDLLKYKKEGT